MEQQQQTKLPTEPNWNDAPEWAEWFAIDEGVNNEGDGYWFSVEPYINNDKGYWWPTNEDGVGKKCGKFDATNWQNSLQQRPQQ